MRNLLVVALTVGARALRLSPAPIMRESAAPAASPLFSRRNLLAGGAAAAVGAAGVQLLKPSTPLFLPAASSMAGETVVITGANTGLGFESALRLAAAGALVVVTARTAAKAQSAVEALRAELGVAGAGAQFVALPLDLADLASVAAFPAALQRALGDGVAVDVLLNNAGVMAIPTRTETADGLERQLGVNHVGHFALVAALMPALERAKRGFRVINVSSDAHRLASAKAMSAAVDASLDPADYTPWGNYALSKAANVLFTKELQRRMTRAGVKGSAVALHPGVVNTDLGRFLFADSASGGLEAVVAGKPLAQLYTPDPRTTAVVNAALGTFLLSTDQGANTQVWLAAAADAGGDLTAHGGLYYDDLAAVRPNPMTEDEQLAQRLWEETARLAKTDIKF